MARKSSSSCAICEDSNLPSTCAGCVNYRLNDYNTSLRSLNATRDSLYSRLNRAMAAKKKADDQLKWRDLKKEKLAKLKEKLCHLKKQLSQGKENFEKKSKDLKLRSELLESSFATLENNRVELLEKYYPNFNYTQRLGHMAITSDCLKKQSVVIEQICVLFPMRQVNQVGEEKYDSNTIYDQVCNVCLPRGLDSHPVPYKELSASLGYMLQLLNIVIPTLAAPALHNSGFAGSCSRIWQRDSYWNTRPSLQSKEYPLFIPSPTFCFSDENSWSCRMSSNFAVSSVESERKFYLEASGSSSFNYSASPHFVENRKNLQKGISLLKRSVACITAYCYNSLFLDVPSETSTFKAFAKLLATLSSGEMRSVSSLKMACSRSCKQDEGVRKRAWYSKSGVLSNGLARLMPNSSASFFDSPEAMEPGEAENIDEGWDMVERPTSQAENIKHWTRAIVTDARKK